ncbi:hypothetical protein GGI35DRAFT_463636 [Trichoderma velutinum]
MTSPLIYTLLIPAFLLLFWMYHSRCIATLWVITVGARMTPNAYLLYILAGTVECFHSIYQELCLPVP